MHTPAHAGHYSGYRFWCLPRELQIPEVAEHCRSHGGWRSRSPIRLANGTLYTSPRSAADYHQMVVNKQRGCPSRHASLSGFSGMTEEWAQWYPQLPSGQAPWPDATLTKYCLARNFMRSLYHMSLVYGERLHLVLQEELEADTAGMLGRVQVGGRLACCVAGPQVKRHHRSCSHHVPPQQYTRTTLAPYITLACCPVCSCCQDVLGLPRHNFTGVSDVAVNSGDAPGLGKVTLRGASSLPLPETAELVRPELRLLCEELQARFGVERACKWWGIPAEAPTAPQAAEAGSAANPVKPENASPAAEAGSTVQPATAENASQPTVAWSTTQPAGAGSVQQAGVVSWLPKPAAASGSTPPKPADAARSPQPMDGASAMPPAAGAAKVVSWLPQPSDGAGSVAAR